MRALEVRRLWRYVRSKQRSMMHHPVASIPSSKIGVLRLEETSMEILKLGKSAVTLWVSSLKEETLPGLF